MPAELPAADHTGRRKLRAWYADPLGKTLLEAERAALEEVLPNLFGYHLVQVGALSPDDLLESSRINHKVVIDPDPELVPTPGILGYPDGLPLTPGTIDVVLLPHTLEFEQAPHEVLREVERALIPEGHVVIVTFNPWSMWGLWRVALHRGRRAPWHGHYLGLTRIKDWLALLGFDTVHVSPVFFRPPLKGGSFMRRLRFMDRAGRRAWPIFAAVNIVVGKKRVATLTPIRPRWRPQRSLVPVIAKSPSGVEHG